MLFGWASAAYFAARFLGEGVLDHFGQVARGEGPSGEPQREFVSLSHRAFLFPALHSRFGTTPPHRAHALRPNTFWPRSSARCPRISVFSRCAMLSSTELGRRATRWKRLTSCGLSFSMVVITMLLKAARGKKVNVTVRRSLAPMRKRRLAFIQRYLSGRQAIRKGKNPRLCCG